MISIRRVLAFAVLVPLCGSLDGCTIGNHQCDHYGMQECTGSPGHYRVCSGGEGDFYWADKTCSGIAPQCQAGDVDRIRCVDTATPVACAASLTWPAGVALGRLADVDGDGVPDNLSINGGNNTVSIALGDAAGGFRPPSSVPLGVAGRLLDALPARVDADAVPDLVVTSTDPDELYVFRATGSLSYEFVARSVATPARQLVAAADFDGDGIDEVLGIVPFEAVHVLSSLGGASLEDQAFGHSHDGPWAAAVANFDGTPPRDVAIFHAGVCDTFIAGVGGTHTQTAALNGELLADLDHDGQSDVVGRAVSGTGLHVTFAGTGGSFTRAIDIPLPYNGTLAVGDFNGDQIDDVVSIAVRDKDTALVATILSQGDGTLAPPAIASVPIRGSVMQRVSTLDFDRDGRSDLVIQTNDGTTHVFKSACLQ